MAEVIAALARAAETWPDRTAFRDDETSCSFRELAARVAGAAERLAEGTGPVGLMAANGIDWVVADLAVTASGRCLVPLPPFFSDDQLAHVAGDAELSLILCDEDNKARAASLAPVETLFGPDVIGKADTGLLRAPRPGQRIIYTSGSTGRPKGVRLGDRQLDHISAALARAISATSADSYLSILPFPLLLEELCGIHVPILVGGLSVIRRHVAGACAGGDLDAIRLAFEEVRPSVSVLVPELLRAWVGALLLADAHAPSSLRAVAVGGAPVPPQVLQAAASLGIPCLEGYGLSECGSVVAVNRPGAVAAGTAGKVLDGLTVTIEEGEITVSGPSVMSGYAGGPDHQGSWRTGDLGRFDAAGNLIVEGRKDAMLVTAYGRNVQPEWIEAQLQGDPRILRAVLCGHGAPYPIALIVAGVFAGDFFQTAEPAAIIEALQGVLTGIPDYALPRSFAVLTGDEMQAFGLLSPNGRPRRKEIETWIKGPEGQARLKTASRMEEKSA